MKELNEQEKKYIDEMLELHRQRYMATSWKRRGDLTRAINKRENQWWQYLDYKRGKNNAKLS